MSTLIDRDRTDLEPASDPMSPFDEDHARRVRLAARKPPKRSIVRKLFSWLVVAGLIAGAVWAGSRLVGLRVAAADQVSLGDATLTAAPVAIPSPGNGQVAAVDVRQSEQVAAGQTLVRLRLFGTDAQGRVQTSSVDVQAPIAGVVASVGTPTGGAVRQGGSVVELYDPARETFETTVGTDTVSRLRRGMHATLTSPALPGSVPAVVDHVVSPLAGGASPPDGTASGAPAGDLTVVLRPLRRGMLRGLTPGLRFTAVVDTSTAPPGAPAIARVVGS